MKPDRVFLIGLRGTGKSTLGREFASRIQSPFYDMDELIEEKAGTSIRSIFESEGESGFRQREHEALVQLCEMSPPLVIATGGGVILREDNRELLYHQGWTVWLNASPEICWNRMNKDINSIQRRPALLKEASDGLAEMKEIFAQRESLYQKCADFELNAEPADTESILATLQCAYEEMKEWAE